MAAEDMARSEPNDQRQRTVVLCKVENEVEAQIVEDALSERGIACTVDRSHETAYDGLFSMVKPCGIVLVLERDLERARDVLADLQNRPGAEE